ncbi:hypothetical protein Taro_014040 [Colocasia esculenta]|uniref:Uncharacterized protein n=1 Tax=Colocasia esculenta TaxID=4460 RepID=A0A843U828_COLES|nr:hypothetical protein [Colocasia esculenta]
MRSHRRPATTLPERNLGTRPKISECDLVSTESKCRFRIGASQAVPIPGRPNIHVLPKGGWNKAEPVTISAMFVCLYQRPVEEISRRVEHDF